MQREELAAWLRLSLTPGVGNHTARRLLAAYGLPHNLFGLAESQLANTVSAAQARALLTPPPGFAAQLERTWQWLHSAPAAGADPARPDTPVNAIITLGDAAYPPALLATEDPPLLLYLTGAQAFVPSGQTGAPTACGPFAPAQCLAMVGSRNPTAQGSQHAYQFAKALHQAGLCIVSGLALGVDAAAHEGALDAAATQPQLLTPLTPATLAVVGTGLDQVYPRAHQALAQRIARQGVLISEYPLGTPPRPTNFPKRNRIIAGLSQGTLVVEAALASGSLITARLAAEQGREVFAIPGSIHAPQSRGCHALIRQGAKLVETAQDVLEDLHLATRQAQSSPQSNPKINPKTGTRTRPQPKATLPTTAAPTTQPLPPANPAAPAPPLLADLGFDPIGLDALVARTGLDTASLQVQLLELELQGLVARLPGGWYQRVGQA